MTAAERLQRLSPKDREVLDLMELGLTDKELCDRVGRSVSTNRNFNNRVFKKLDVGTRTAASRIVWQAREDALRAEVAQLGAALATLEHPLPECAQIRHTIARLEAIGKGEAR